MTYAYETKYDAKSFTAGRQGNSIIEIVMHHWGIDGQSHSGVVRFFTGAATSAHYVASAGKVSCLVNVADTAYHAGNWNVNLRSIGIECRPEMSAGDFETVAELIADIRKVYGNIPLRIHKQYSNTACPGRWEAQIAKLSARANEIRSGSNPTTTPVNPKPTPAPAKKSYGTMAAETIDGLWGVGEDRFRRWRAAGYDDKKLQALVNQLLGHKGGKKSDMTVAQETMAGLWGNEPERSKRWRASGYDPKAIQPIINRLM